MSDPRLIESDRFPFEFLSTLAKRESWRKEVHRPIYHVHKWWAKRLGSVFRGLALGCVLGEEDDLAEAFYKSQEFPSFLARSVHGFGASIAPRIRAATGPRFCTTSG